MDTGVQVSVQVLPFHPWAAPSDAELLNHMAILDLIFIRFLETRLF